MAFSFKKFWKGITLVPNSSNTTSEKGDLQVLDSDGKLYYHNGTTSSSLVTATQPDQGPGSLKNKDLDDSTVVFVDTTDTTIKIGFDAAGTTGTKTTLQSSQTVNRTLILPDATDTLVARNTTDTLTNKTLTNPTINGGSITGSAITATNANLTTPTISGGTITILDNNLTLQDNGDNTKQLKFNASDITTGTTRTLSSPDADTTIVGTDVTQTLTNKTLALASNSITGTADHVVIMSGTGVETTEANLAISRGGTNAATANAGFNNLAPTTTKGDLIAHDGSINIRVPVGVDNQILTADSGETAGFRWANLGAFTAPTIQTFTTSDTYVTPTTPPPLYVKVTVIAQGGGGGGGSNVTAGGGGGGGGGGGCAVSILTPADIGVSQVITINTGGSGGGNQVSGTAGGDASFGALLSATGGGGGTGAVATNGMGGGVGGVGSGGNVANMRGNGGSSGTNGVAAVPVGGSGGGAGGSFYCGAGNGGSPGANGGNGFSYGGGGGGGGGSASGGDPLTGFVEVIEYYQ